MEDVCTYKVIKKHKVAFDTVEVGKILMVKGFTLKTNLLHQNKVSCRSTESPFK